MSQNETLPRSLQVWGHGHGVQDGKISALIRSTHTHTLLQRIDTRITELFILNPSLLGFLFYILILNHMTFNMRDRTVNEYKNTRHTHRAAALFVYAHGRLCMTTELKSRLHTHTHSQVFLLQSAALNLCCVRCQMVFLFNWI